MPLADVVVNSLTEIVGEAGVMTENEVLSHVAGYCVINDVSERTFQLEGTGQWVKGKGADTFGPIGPRLSPARP
jgi:2-keto-4-pentenoate hydratase/2-oxohepta-3-ene-1,7-dioic acid hydratase in catechol pathway